MTPLSFSLSRCLQLMSEVELCLAHQACRRSSFIVVREGKILRLIEIELQRRRPPPPPITESQVQLLKLLEQHPGISRAELARLLWPKQNQYYSNKRIRKITKRLEVRGLIEYGVIHEGGRYGVLGIYIVGKPQPQRAGYLGVFGWVET